MERTQTPSMRFLIEKARQYAQANFRPIGPLDTDDLAQMAMIKLARHQEHVHVPLPYLYRTIRSVAIDASRHYAREARRTIHLNSNISDACMVFEPASNDYLSQLEQVSHLTVKDDAEAHEIVLRVNATLRQMSPIIRKPLLLFADGFSYREISKILHIPLGTVRSRIYYARKRAFSELADLI